MANIATKNLFNVEGLVAVVTGGGTGIGLMITKALAFNGAHKVYILGRRKHVLDEAAKLSPNIIPIASDVTSKSDLESIAAKVKSEVGYLNLLVNNSGAMGPKVADSAQMTDIKDFVKSAWEAPIEDFTHTFNVNVSGVYYTTLAFLELLDAGNKKGNMNIDAKKGGFDIGRVDSQVVTVSSIAGFSRMRGASFAYNASKTAATHLMKHLSTFLIPFKIRCNVIAPGIFPSDMGDRLIAQGIDQSKVPAERPGSEEDMAGTILYLASRAGAYLNGNVVVLDGGRLGVLNATY